MTMGEKRKPVIFNLDKPEQREMYKFADSCNFSAWVRGCIKRELAKRAKSQSEITYRAEG